jgi:predicted enzyme related to lactoylglutathione lyase
MVTVSINIDVDDLEKGVAFYTAAFGLVPVRRFGRAVVELAGAQAPVYLLLKAASKPPFPGAQVARDYHRHWTAVHLDLVVDDMDAAVARALAAGARAESETQRYDWGRMTLMSDPFGHGFCLIQLDAPGYEAIATPYTGGPIT